MALLTERSWATVGKVLGATLAVALAIHFFSGLLAGLLMRSVPFAAREMYPWLYAVIYGATLACHAVVASFLARLRFRREVLRLLKEIAEKGGGDD